MFFFGVFMGIYIGVYALFLQGTLVKIAEVANGFSYILFAVALWMLP
jgi:hypothetical protein